MGSVENAVTWQPLAKLTAIMRLASRVNAALLVLTGVIGLFGALTTPALDSFSSALLSVYVGGFGALLLRYEFASTEGFRREHGWMYMFAGRAAFLLLSANLCWTCGWLGFPTALLTNANALFSAYVLWHHPAFVEGQVSRTAIGSVSGADDDDGGRPSGFTYAADPASEAARMAAADGGAHW